MRFVLNERNPFSRIMSEWDTYHNEALIRDLAEELYRVIERDYRDVLRANQDKTTLEIGGGMSVAPSEKLVERGFKAYEIDLLRGGKTREVEYIEHQNWVVRLKGDIIYLLKDREWGDGIFPSKLVLFWGSGAEYFTGQNWNIGLYCEKLEVEGKGERWSILRDIFKGIVEKTEKGGYIVLVSPRFSCHTEMYARPSIGDATILKERENFLKEARILEELGGDVTVYGCDATRMKEIIDSFIGGYYRDQVKKVIEEQGIARIKTPDGAIEVCTLIEAEPVIRDYLNELERFYGRIDVPRIDAVVARFP